MGLGNVQIDWKNSQVRRTLTSAYQNFQQSRFGRWLKLGFRLMFRRSRWNLTRRGERNLPQGVVTKRYRLDCPHEYDGMQVMDLIDVLMSCDPNAIVVADGMDKPIGDVAVCGMVVLCKES